MCVCVCVSTTCSSHVVSQSQAVVCLDCRPNAMTSWALMAPVVERVNDLASLSNDTVHIISQAVNLAVEKKRRRKQVQRL